ncbi:TVP38/TMEM64 family protein [Ghiorsea bivora]|uniref:TVP38/TMEM64 family protein n=1 Tax=Ghiorsea bivora TaxID=1485545 RepID=UPI00056ED097|nr:TVP38/TMEM64 family protein [Ghiorsea bivora]
MLKKSLPLLIIAALTTLFFMAGWHEYLSFEQLRTHRLELNTWVAEKPFISALAYILMYITVVTLSLPGGTVMTLAGGFFFCALWGGLYTVVGATIGATMIFLIAKTSLGDVLLAKAGKSIQSMRTGFQENALNYMFVLRLVPLFPFFIVNLAPAFLGVPLRTYIIATFFGIMPATFVFALAGSGLGKVFEQGEHFSVSGILTPEMMGALIGLALLSLIPVFYKKWQNRGAS